MVARSPDWFQRPETIGYAAFRVFTGPGTIKGGSGGIAQAFERLDLTDSEGSLWWTLQTELGSCPIGNGEALVPTVLSRATAQQIQATQDIHKHITDPGDNCGLLMIVILRAFEFW